MTSSEAEILEGPGFDLFGVGWRKFMMWIFIASDALTFGGFLAAYGFLRMTSAAWPVQTEIFDMRLITLMTFVLISSSAVMAMAVGAAGAGDTNTAAKFVGLTMLGGLLFLGMQAYEWAHFIGEGATPWENPWGVPAFGASFFLITGFHGLHVLSGVLVLAWATLRARKGVDAAPVVENAGLYWHFVDVVWVFVFAFFYLL